MSEEVRVIKSPIAYDFEEAKERLSTGVIAFAVTLPNGAVVTNSNQF
jgi:hypothetical protein